MNSDLLKNFGLDSSLNQNDIQLLQQILSSVGQNSNSNVPNISTKERNNLISKLSSNTTLNEIPKKEFKNMNEQEKKIYREELRQKLKNKQNEKKIMRTSNLIKQNKIETICSNTIGKMNSMVNNVDDDLSNQVNKQEKNLTNVKQEVIINNIINGNNDIKHNTNIDTDNLDIDNLDNYIHHTDN